MNTIRVQHTLGEYHVHIGAGVLDQLLELTNRYLPNRRVTVITDTTVERHYEDWLELLTEDVRYWMPMRRNIKFGELEREFTREGHDINWFDEGKDTLTRRVNQILTGVHWAEEPLSRITHMVSNVQVLGATPSWSEPEETTAKTVREYDAEKSFLVMFLNYDAQTCRLHRFETS